MNVLQHFVNVSLGLAGIVYKTQLKRNKSVTVTSNRSRFAPASCAKSDFSAQNSHMWHKSAAGQLWKWPESGSYLRNGHVQVEKEPRGGGDLQHHHHDHHHRHPHLGRRFPAPRPARPAGRDHHVGGGLAAHRSEVILVLLLCARSGHGIPDAWADH